MFLFSLLLYRLNTISQFYCLLTDRGILLTMGEGRAGCLGHGDTRDLASPRIVEALLGDDITALAAGTSHVAVVTGDGELFTWGQGGGLGQGQGYRETLTSPEIVDLEEDVEKVRDSPASTAICYGCRLRGHILTHCTVLVDA